MSKCGDCPVKSGVCVGERGGADGWAWACPAAARGESLAAIEAASAATAGLPIPAPTSPSLPSLGRMAANLVGSAVAIAASGVALVDDEEYARRRAVCKACPTGRYLADVDRCAACGCWMAYKPRYKAMTCEDGHW